MPPIVVELWTYWIKKNKVRIHDMIHDLFKGLIAQKVSVSISNSVNCARNNKDF